MGILAAFITAGLLAVAVTGVMNSFQDGETLTAGKLNTNFNSLKAAIESLPNWTKSGSDAVFSNGNVIVNTTTAANSAVVTVNGKISSSVLGVYCGATAGLVTGNMGGYTGAKALCETACSNTNAHMCTAHEISISRQLGISISSNLWYTSYSFGFQSGTDTIDCAGWTDGTATARGPKAYPSPGQPGNDFCNATLPVACCL